MHPVVLPSGVDILLHGPGGAVAELERRADEQPRGDGLVFAPQAGERLGGFDGDLFPEQNRCTVTPTGAPQYTLHSVTFMPRNAGRSA